MSAPTYRKVSNAVLRKLSRALSLADNDGIASLNDTILLNIFFHLNTPDLITVSMVCRRWNKLSSHPMLWKSVDLRRYAKPLQDEYLLENVTKSYLAYKVVCLDISGFTIPQTILNTMASVCPDLKKLVLKSVTFYQNSDQLTFPANLEYLDVRYSYGPTAIYQAMAKQMSRLKWLGICDALLLALSNEQALPNGFNSLQNLEKLDMTHCQLVRDEFLFKFCPCKNLKLLSLRKCLNVTGESFPALIPRLSGLGTLILDGTSIQDENLALIDWENTKIKYLELGWCPFITSEGLKTFLPTIAKIKSLEYLGLCNLGQGHAVTDYILLDLAKQLQQGTCPSLHSLNLSFSKEITNEGLVTFESMCYIDNLDVTKCAQITEDEEDDEFIFFEARERDENESGKSEKDKKHDNSSVMRSVPYHRSNSRSSVSSTEVEFRSRTASRTSLSDMRRNGSRVSLSSMGDEGEPRMRRRSSRGSFSTIQFALSNYTLETPL